MVVLFSMCSIKMPMRTALIYYLLLRTVRVAITCMFYNYWELPVTEFFGLKKLQRALKPSDVSYKILI